MAIVSIDFPGAGAALADVLDKHLSEYGVAVVRSGNLVKVDTSTVEECERVGQLLADFVFTMEGDYPLHMTGPGGNTRLSQLRTDEDARMISGLLTACADLL